MKVRLSRRAQDDLAEIATYLFARSPQAAANVEKRLTDALEIIAVYPFSGRAVTGGRRRVALRRFPYAIFYRVDPVTGLVTIVTIRHGARRPEA